jgi:hypothetical protein
MRGIVALRATALLVGAGLVAATATATPAAADSALDFRFNNFGASNRCVGIPVDLNPGLVLGVAGGSTANGANLVLSHQQSHPDQYWSEWT